MQQRIADFTFQNKQSVPNYDSLVARVRAAYDAFDATEKRIIPDIHCRGIDIYRNVEGSIAGYAPTQGKIMLASDPSMEGSPAFLRPMHRDFDLVAAHELYHPIMVKLGSSKAAKDPRYITGRRAIFQRIAQDYPEVQEKITAATEALDAYNRATRTEKDARKKDVMELSMGWDKIDPSSQEQMVFYTGLLLSDAYHKAFGYEMEPTLLKPDTTYDEDMCNVRALAYIFGRDKMQVIAGELLDHGQQQSKRYGELLDLRAKMHDGTPRKAMEKMALQKQLSALEDEFGGDRYGALIGGHAAAAGY